VSPLRTNSLTPQQRNHSHTFMIHTHLSKVLLVKFNCPILSYSDSHRFVKKNYSKRILYKLSQQWPSQELATHIIFNATTMHMLYLFPYSPSMQRLSSSSIIQKNLKVQKLTIVLTSSRQNPLLNQRFSLLNRAFLSISTLRGAARRTFFIFLLQTTQRGSYQPCTFIV